METPSSRVEFLLSQTAAQTWMPPASSQRNSPRTLDVQLLCTISFEISSSSFGRAGSVLWAMGDRSPTPCRRTRPASIRDKRGQVKTLA